MIALAQARVTYGAVVALAGLDLTVEPGEWIGLLGPSGSGKTSALRAIAGFERIAGGRIAVGEVTVAGDRAHVAPERRGVGFVFQEFALFPHLTVARNVAFGLRALGRAERGKRVAEALECVEMAHLADRLPSALSGGQQQRVALARALAPSPSVLLMDEPFGSLDPALRARVRGRVVDALRATGCTVIFISHDLPEALSIADRVALLRDGHLEQLGAPEDLYLRPDTAFAASFAGPVNAIEGEAEGETLRTALGDLALAHPAKGRRLAVVRPHQVALVEAGREGRVEGRTFVGPEAHLTVTVDGTRLEAHVRADHPARVGDRVGVQLDGPFWTVPAG